MLTILTDLQFSGLQNNAFKLTMSTTKVQSMIETV